MERKSGKELLRNERSILIFIGSPTAGKSSLTDLMISEYKDITTTRGGSIAPLEITREFASNRDVVPDEIYLKFLYDKLQVLPIDGINIFDNIPRSKEQADLVSMWAKENGITIFVVCLNLSDEQVVERAKGRLQCPKCGSSFHPKLRPPVSKGTCDKDGTNLISKLGDEDKKLKAGNKRYHELKSMLSLRLGIEPILIDASGTVDETFKKVESALKNSEQIASTT